MFEVDLGEVIDEIEKGGEKARDLWDDGRYKLEIINANGGKTRGEEPKPKLGIQWKVLDGGNHIGETQWENLTLNKTSKFSKKLFVARLEDLGLDREFLRTSPSLETIAEMIQGVVVLADVTREPWKSDPKKIEQRFAIVKRIDTNAPESEEEEASGEDDGLFGDLG